MADSADAHVLVYLAEVRGVTHQVTSLARAIDRLPPGEYVIHLDKATRMDSWRAEIRQQGAVVREMELKRDI